jgi:stage II sporulation protein D
MNRKLVVWVIVWLSSIIIITLLIPGIVVKKIRHSPPHPNQDSAFKSEAAVQAVAPIVVPIYLTKQAKVETLPLEAYVTGVVAAEMPIEFEIEALKAQAMAARTYIVRRIVDQDYSNVPVKNALVTDTVAHQVFLTKDQLLAKWGAEYYPSNMEKINRAVSETKDLILTYAHKPINATFFSTSNGYTENSEDYWGEYIPYLRSVASPWDQSLSPRFNETLTFTTKDFFAKLGMTPIVPASTGNKAIKVLDVSEGHRIKKISIAGKILTGKEVRERLGLNSSQFQWNFEGSRIEITTTGYGHGVGMSQWGADGMARAGETAAEIVKHYYTGIAIERAEWMLPTK